jgi:hypothetical protein
MPSPRCSESRPLSPSSSASGHAGPAEWGGAAVATAAFFVAVSMYCHWIDLINGVTSVNPGEAWVLHPAPVVLPCALIAAAGAGFAGALAIRIGWRQVGRSG